MGTSAGKRLSKSTETPVLENISSTFYIPGGNTGFTTNIDELECSILKQEGSLKSHTAQVKVPSVLPLPTVMVVKALFEYRETDASDPEYLHFSQGELMEIVSSDGDWWLARRMNGSEVGYIPSNFVEPVDSLQIHPWYHGNISRIQAEAELRQEDNITGTFLVRESQNSQNSHALSILTNKRDKNNLRAVRHYRIKSNNDQNALSTSYFIVSFRTFKSIPELIASYIEDPKDLCCPLYLSCPKHTPTMYDLNKTTSENPEIAFKELSFTDKLSEGYFGEVWKGKYQAKKEVAIKRLKAGTMPADKFLDEAKTMKTLRHERLVPLLAVSFDSSTLYIISELLRESLLDFLKRSPKQHISNLLIIALQIAEGMAYMESQGYIHRDLAARNVLMVDDTTLKIGDFGLARMILDSGMYIPSEEPKVPIRWTALEALKEKVFTVKSDVWAYGILLVELTSKGLKPYPGISNYELLGWLSTGKRHVQPPFCPPYLYYLMLDCWKDKPERRPDFSDIVTEIQEMLTRYCIDVDDDPYITAFSKNEV